MVESFISSVGRKLQHPASLLLFTDRTRKSDKTPTNMAFKGKADALTLIYAAEQHSFMLQQQN